MSVEERGTAQARRIGRLARRGGVFAVTAALTASAGAAEDIRSASQPTAQPVAGAMVAMPSPLAPAEVTALGTLKVQLDPAAYAELRSANQVVFTDFSLDAEHRADLELERFEIFTDDARLVVVNHGVETPLARPDIVLLSGRVAGDADSRVFLALSPVACQGQIQTGGQTYILSSGPFTADVGTQIYRLGAIAPELLQWTQPVCSGVREIPGRALKPAAANAEAPRAIDRGLPCRESYFAIETDHEFLAGLFGGSEMVATMYVAALMGAVSDIHTRELNNRIRVTYLRLWATTDDPWTRGSTGEQLDEYRAYWNAQMTHIQRTAAHYLSGRGLGGGVAYVGATCYPEYDYGLSANLGGYFPLPLVDHSGQNWDPFVVAHEIGHNYGTFHTHDGYTPVIDGCGLGDCSQAWGGTIMSYCHTCSGGMTNISLTYHPRVIDRILAFLDDESVCDLVLGPPTITDQPDRVSACPGVSVSLTAAGSGGTPLSYQWRLNGAAIPGATGAMYSVSVSAATAGLYDVIVSNACDSTTSAAARVVLKSADLNQDGVIDFTDYLEFLNRFDGLDETVDFTADGLVDYTDYLEFLNLYDGICS